MYDESTEGTIEQPSRCIQEDMVAAICTCCSPAKQTRFWICPEIARISLWGRTHKQDPSFSYELCLRVQTFHGRD